LLLSKPEKEREKLVIPKLFTPQRKNSAQVLLSLYQPIINPKTHCMKKLFVMTLCASLVLSLSAFSQSGNPGTKEYKTKTGKMVTVTETHPQGASLSNIVVAFKGMKGTEVPFTDVDPIKKVLVADLDNNGFSELYIITLNAGSGSYGNVVGVASNKDKTLSMITFPEVTEADMKKGAKFEGYEGHDIYEIQGTVLVRTFPTKATKAGKQFINYKLKAGEAGYLLYIAN
jgi:hypothetical protein